MAKMDNVCSYCNVNNRFSASSDGKYTVSRGWKGRKTVGSVLRNAGTSSGRSVELCWRARHTTYYKQTIVTLDRMLLDPNMARINPQDRSVGPYCLERP